MFHIIGWVSVRTIRNNHLSYTTGFHGGKRPLHARDDSTGSDFNTGVVKRLVKRPTLGSTNGFILEVLEQEANR